MTYRRLFLRLFIVSTLLLAVLWWVSVRTYTIGIFAPKQMDTYLTATMCSTTISLQLSTPVPAPKFKMFSSFEHGTDADMRAMMGKSIGPLGRFRAKSLFSKGIRGTGTQIRTLSFPVWFPWLLTTAGGYLLMRRLEKRSAGAKEKMLAEEQASGTV
ncbi:MAG: hypothetical protein EOP88_10265 [Verrucomicrobiaceae bacterium]|nr:MAG: hypothetical protein EOP88_10265 [Verrucomicrobiaceae bacterium]